MVQLENWNISTLTLFCNCEHKNPFSNWTNQEVSFKSVVQQSPEIQKKLSKKKHQTETGHLNCSIEHLYGKTSPKIHFLLGITRIGEGAPPTNVTLTLF